MSIRTVGDLRRRLEDYEEDQPLRVARQELHPIASTLKGLTSNSEAGPQEEDDGPYTNSDEADGNEASQDTVWLVLSTPENYDAYRNLWDSAH
jgi:hypothetical protein